MLNAIPEGYGQIDSKNYTTRFCEPLHSTQPARLNAQMYLKIGLIVAVLLICFGLRALISMLDACLIIKNKLKLRILKFLAQLSMILLIIFLICWAIYELTCYFSFKRKI